MNRDPFEIVRDSSIWRHETDQRAISRKDPYLRLGIVKRVSRDTVTSEILYLVEIRDMNDGVEVNARMMRNFGGIYNYEDVVLQGYKVSDQPDATSDFAAKAGDTVLVAFMNGEGREAVILGGITHPGRNSTVPINDGPQYQSEFNGVQKQINSDGEFTVTFKGIPTNIVGLDNFPRVAIPAPTYDTSIGGTFMKFDKTGSWEVNDNNSQNIRVDKAANHIVANSGGVALTLTKDSQGTIKAPKVAFGSDSIELLDQLSQLIDAVGELIAISPVGPCNPLNASPQWQQVMQVQNKIKEITGSLS